MDDTSVLNGTTFAVAMALSGQSGKKAHFQLRNPANSGKIILVDKVNVANIVLPAYWTVRSWPVGGAADSIMPDGVLIPTICNLKFGAGAGVALAYERNQEDILGNLHAEYYNAAGQDLSIQEANYPLVALVPGKSVLFVCHSAASTLCNIVWRQVNQ